MQRKDSALGFAAENKLTWLALAEDHAALSRSLEQLMALPRSVKVKRVLLVSLAAKFLTAARGVRARANSLTCAVGTLLRNLSVLAAVFAICRLGPQLA